jgi:ABC-type lipoprotein export system ATPase subunit/ABC-type antimicrobial peptide transport system permease subunit
MELIRLEDIHKTYRLGEVDVPALRGVSLTIQRGEMVALMGASGSGKTTLMNILGCLDRPTSGKYWFDGQEMSALAPNQRALVRSEKLGFVFQSFNLLARTTAIGNVIMPLDYAPRHLGMNPRATAVELLTRVGLADRMKHEPSQMSGGQQQRVAIARALVNRPALVLADEPTGNLDSHTSVEILRMFQQLNAEGITVILVTHDAHVAAFAHRTIRIADGMIDGDELNSPLSASEISRGEGPPAPHIISGGNGDGDGHGGELVAVGVGIARHAALGAVADLPGSALGATAGLTSSAEDTGGQATRGTRLEAPAAVESKPAAAVRRMTTLRLLPATWRTALVALGRNKMRSCLSALGVIIAVAAVIATTEIGQGSKTALQKSIASMGANRLMVFSGSATTHGVAMGTGSMMTLTPDDAEEIARQCPAVAVVAPTVRARSQIVYGNRNHVPERMEGTTPEYLAVGNWGEMAQGEMFSDRDVRNGNKVCVIGETVSKALFDDESPVGKIVRINNIPFKVLGVLGRKGANMFGMDQDNILLAPWTTIKSRVSGSALSSVNQSASAAASSGLGESVNSLDNRYPGATSLYLSRTASEAANMPQLTRFANIDGIQISAVSTSKVQEAIRQITDLLRERHRIREGDEDDFMVRDMTEFSNMLTTTSKTLSTLLLVVAMISLVVGGVGIMNIMLVSVTERTREIGLRMAVGARSHHILRQFLVESVVLCLLGGAIGIFLGRNASEVVSSIMHWPVETSLPAIAVALAVSVGVGVIFGFYPAWKASRLDPIEALRYE